MPHRRYRTHAPDVSDEMNEPLVNRALRVVVSAGAVAVFIALLARQSADAIVFGRYSIEYSVVLLCFLPLLAAALHYAWRGGDAKTGIRSASRSPIFWIVGVLLALPAVLIAARFGAVGSATDVKRVVGLVFLLLAFVVGYIGMASREGRGLKPFQLGVLALTAGIYAVTLLATPLLGRWVEGQIGISGVSTLDLVMPGEAKGVWRLMHAPNAEFVYPGRPGAVREFSVAVRNNSWGFHDRERSIEDPNERTRIVVLGDTYVQGLEVPMERGFPALLEDRLAADSRRFEVVRLARRGIGQVEELELLREFGARLSPQLVILVWATNDLLDNDPDLAGLQMRAPDALLFPGLLIDRLASKWLWKRTYVLDERLRLGVLRPDYWAYLEPMPSQVGHAVAKTEALLDLIVRECELIGSQFMLVLKRPTNELRWLGRFPSLRDYDFNTNAYDEWLSAYADSRGIHFLDLGPAFQEYYDEYPTGHPKQYSWPLDGHWSEPGHDLAARLIYDYMIANGLVSLGARP